MAVSRVTRWTPITSDDHAAAIIRRIRQFIIEEQPVEQGCSLTICTGDETQRGCFAPFVYCEADHQHTPRLCPHCVAQTNQQRAA